MLVEFHMIQNHAPSNLNRDDTGSPKEATFGGVLRARISSQCLKRSVRQSPIFQEALKGHLGTRTRKLPQQVEAALKEANCPESEREAIVAKVSGFGSDKEDAEQKLTRQLVFLAPDEAPLLAQELRRLYDELGPKEFAAQKPEKLAERLGAHTPRSVDIALFGRMTTSAAFEDVEASLQVAHALGTTRLDHQFDYFTAVDDLSKDLEETGAGHINDTEFNSATYYKYFSLDWQEFVDNLGGDVETARVALSALLQAAALTTPTGKQNAFAAHNPPDAILLEVKDRKIPVSYANAFVAPVRAEEGKDVVQQSIARLSRYVEQLQSAYGLKPVTALWLCPRGEAGPAQAATVANLEALCAGALECLGGANR